MNPYKIMPEKAKYKTLTVEAAKTGWIVKEHGQPAEIFIRWDDLVRKLAKELSTQEPPFKN